MVTKAQLLASLPGLERSRLCSILTSAMRRAGKEHTGEAERAMCAAGKQGVGWRARVAGARAWPVKISHMTMPKLYTSASGVSCECASSSGGMYGIVCAPKQIQCSDSKIPSPQVTTIKQGIIMTLHCKTIDGLRADGGVHAIGAGMMESEYQSNTNISPCPNNDTPSCSAKSLMPLVGSPHVWNA